MKKKIYVLIVLVLVSLFVAMMCRQNDKEYEVINSYKVSADNFQSVTLQIVVNVRKYDEEEMFCKIRDFYYDNEGVVDELRINLYESKCCLKKSHCKTSKIY